MHEGCGESACLDLMLRAIVRGRVWTMTQSWSCLSIHPSHRGSAAPAQLLRTLAVLQSLQSLQTRALTHAPHGQVYAYAQRPAPAAAQHRGLWGTLPGVPVGPTGKGKASPFPAFPQVLAPLQTTG